MKLVNRIKSMLFGLIFVCVGWVVIYVFGQVSLLHCTRPEPSQVACVNEVTLLRLIPLREETIRDVRGAWIDESCDSDGCTYRVVLDTGEGDVPLTSYYSSGWERKRETVTQINEYVGGGGGETLEVREGIGILAALFGGIFMIVGAGMAIARGRQQSFS